MFSGVEIPTGRCRGRGGVFRPCFVRATALLVLSAATFGHTGVGVPVRVASTDEWPAATLRDTAQDPDGTIVAVADTAAHELLVVVSSDMGASWSAPVVVATGYDPIVSLAGDVVDVVWGIWADVLPYWSYVRHRRSTDRGQTWGPENDVGLAHDDGGVRFKGGVTTAADGRLVVQREYETGSALWSTRSSDGGATWSPSVKVDGYWGYGASQLLWTGPDDLLTCQSGVACYLSSDGGLSFGSWPTLRLDGQSYPFHLVPSNFGVVLLAVETRNYKTVAVRSLNGGRTWTAPVVVDPPTCGYGPLAAASGSAGVWVLQHDCVITSIDGINWTTKYVVEPSGCYAHGLIHFLHAGGPGVALRIDAGQAAATSDGGLGWNAIAAPVPAHDPVLETSIVRTTGGRLVAAWITAGRLPPQLLSAYSDDEAKTWSPPSVVADVAPTAWSNLPAERLRMTATASGGVAVVWAAIGPFCDELRVSRSLDGSGFEPSAHLGRNRNFEMGDDGIGVVVVLQPGPNGFATVSQSFDGGGTWSPAFEMGLPNVNEIGPVVVNNDGELVVAMSHDRMVDSYAGPTVIYRSSDGGTTWTAGPEFAFSELAYGLGSGPFGMVAAGPRLVLQIHHERLWSAKYDSLHESFDGGRTWIDLTDPIHPIAGDPAGNAYHLVGDELHGARPGGGDVNFGPLRGVLVSAVATSPWRPVVLYADPTTSSGVFSNTFDSQPLPISSPALHRDDSLLSLSPRPEFARLFPIRAYLGAELTAPGMLDPDPQVVEDGDRPLVLYALDGTRSIYLTKTNEAWGKGLKITW